MSEILPPLDSSAALRKKEEIDTLLAAINIHQLKLAKSFARLGCALKEVKVEMYWQSYGFDRFSSYLESIWETIGKKRSQVYAILSVSETLLPHLNESQLEEIGITKAYELQRLVKNGGRVDAFVELRCNPEATDVFEVQIMDYAADPKVTAAQLRVKVNELLHQTETPQGLWLDLSGFYATSEERKEIEDFWKLGRTMTNTTDESADHVWRKVVFLDAVRECLGEWQAEFADGR